MSLKLAEENKIFANILADGKLHVTVPEDTEGAITRKYKTSDGLEGSKTELVYSEVKGKISEIKFYEGSYGRNIQLTITDGEDKPIVVSLSTSSSFGEDLMKKIIAVDMERVVKIIPYSFLDDKGKSKKGITLYQKEEGKNPEKVKNYFYDEEAKKTLHGFPEPKKGKKPLSKDQWKLYFGEVREFLVEKVKEHFKIEDESMPEITSDEIDF